MRTANSTMKITPSATPTPISAFAPPLRPEEGLVVDEGNLGKPVIPEADVAALEGMVVDDDREDLLVEVAKCRVADVAPEAIVVTAFPAVSTRNLPTPVSQQLVVWSQQ